MYYLDITLDLNAGTYKPYQKPNDETLYPRKILAKSNHPVNILKKLPISIESRLSYFSRNPEIFNEGYKHYQNIFDQSVYDNKLQYKLPNNKNENKCKSLKNCKRNITWFKPPFLKERLKQHR